MWIIGTFALLVLGAAATLTFGWWPRPTSSPPIWDLTRRGGATAANASTFAGFSLASAIFIAGLDGARTTPAFPTVFGMMLVGFLVLLVANWINGSAPETAEAEDAIAPALVIVFGNLCTNLGVAITWVALVPLLALVGLGSLAGVFISWLLVMAVASTAWFALVAYRLTLANGRACLAIPILSLSLPTVYRLVAVRRWPTLWPESDPALHYAFVALGAAAILFFLHMGLLLAHGETAYQWRLRRHGIRLALGASQAFAIVVVMLWFAIAAP